MFFFVFFPSWCGDYESRAFIYIKWSGHIIIYIVLKICFIVESPTWPQGYNPWTVYFLQIRHNKLASFLCKPHTNEIHKGLARLFAGAQDPIFKAQLYQIMFMLLKLDKLQTFSLRPLDDPSFSLPISQPLYF